MTQSKLIDRKRAALMAELREINKIIACIERMQEKIEGIRNQRAGERWDRQCRARSRAT